MHTGIRTSLAGIAVAVAGILGAGCSLEDPVIPPVTGPSEFSTSLNLSASPDQLPRDGQSQSVVTLVARDVQGRPISGLRLVLGISPSSATLSQSEVTTDAAGRATVAVTAPAAGTTGNTITVSATPIGTDADNAIPRFVLIGVLGVSNSSVPVPSFTVTPTSPEVNQLTTLDASATTDEGAACRDACTYAWDLGGEATRTGRIITYQFQIARIYNVALTVTDAAGSSATTRTNVTVTAVAKPTVTMSVSPTSPTAGQPAVFTATPTVATNHRVAAIEWNFGDGTTASTTNNSVQKTYSTAGTYIVVVTVRDELGQTGSTTTSVTVGSGITFPTTPFTVSPTAPRATEQVIFNAGGVTTTGGATITKWTWNFGDGTDEVEKTNATVTHTFPTSTIARTYVVRLTVTDSAGRTASTSRDIAVTATP